MDEFKTASVRDFAVVLHGKSYTPAQLETLPFPLRPSTLATKKSDHALVFFTKLSVLSNHSPSDFTIQNKLFSNMEQYLAYNRAETSQQHDLAERALQTKDPVQAKFILNSLRNDHDQDWQRVREEITMVGLRAKFTQNPHLADYLKSTSAYQLGEASKNLVWGVGITLDDENILDTDKWIDSGNLLGELLMKVRSELLKD